MNLTANTNRNLTSLIMGIFGMVFALLLVYVYRSYGLQPTQIFPIYIVLSALAGIGALLRWRFGVIGLLYFMPFVGSIMFFFSLSGGIGSLLKDLTFYLPGLVGFIYIAVTDRTIRIQLRPLLLKTLKPAIACLALLLIVLTVIFFQFNFRYTAFIILGFLGLKLLLGYVPLLLMGYFLFQDFEKFQKFIRQLGLFSLFISATVILQFFLLKLGIISSQNYATGQGTLYGDSFIRDDGIYRLSGTFSAPAQLSYFLTFHLILMVVLFLSDEKRWRIIWQFGILLTLTAVVFTGQKALILLAPIMIIVTCLVYGRLISLLKLSFSILAVGLLAFVIAPENISAQSDLVIERFSDRTDTVSFNAQQLSTIFTNSDFLIGHGLGTGAPQARYLLGGQKFIETYQAKLIYEIGLFGTFLYYATLLTMAIVLGQRNRNTRPEVEPYVRFCLLIFVFCAVLPIPYYEFDPTNVYVWLFYGIGLGLTALPKAPLPAPAP